MIYGLIVTRCNPTFSSPHLSRTLGHVTGSSREKLAPWMAWWGISRCIFDTSTLGAEMHVKLAIR
jgi:hypothetical protein